MRTILAVVAGYVIFAVSAVLLFHLTNIDPHSPATIGFEALTIAYGLAFAFVSGFVAGRIGRDDFYHCPSGRGCALDANCRSDSSRTRFACG